MANFGWSLPPGCSQRDIDEAFGGGDEASAFAETMLEKCADLINLDEAIADRIIDYAWKQFCSAYQTGYANGQADANYAAEVVNNTAPLTSA